MNVDHGSVPSLRNLWRDTRVPEQSDYLLFARFGAACAARSRFGQAALVVPLPTLAERNVGRRSAGIELLGHSAAQFTEGENEWRSPAAALVCLDAELVDTFAVLAADIALRFTTEVASWSSIVALVEEWQTLLSPRGKPSQEAEAGLWGELWFIDSSESVGRTLAAWRGPDRDAADFFVDGEAAEVKTGRLRRQHHVSQAQVDFSVGTHPAWLVSIWIKVDPEATATVPVLVDRILERAPDAADALRRIVRAGYSPANRSGYATGFVVLEEPEWYSAGSVPRVRAADLGVSDLRYRVTLDEQWRADAESARRLWRHFHGRDFGSL
jgi:hypothetical protein